MRKGKNEQARVEPPQLPSPENVQALDESGFEEDGTYQNLELSDDDLGTLDVRNLTIENSRFSSMMMLGASLDKIRLTDIRFEKCNLSNSEWTKAALSRVELLGCRITGLSLVEGKSQDFALRECKADLARFSGAVFKNCSFEDTNLRDADLRGAKLQNVSFVRCDLNGAELYNVQLKNVDLRGSRLDGVKFHLEDLRGAIIDSEQLIGLAPSLAEQLGITIK